MTKTELLKSFDYSDVELIRDLYLSLSNESEFYPQLSALYRSAEKRYLAKEFDEVKFCNALQKMIADYCLNGPRHFSYNRKFFPLIPVGVRLAVANEFSEYLISELDLGNSWLGNK